MERTDSFSRSLPEKSEERHMEDSYMECKELEKVSKEWERTWSCLKTVGKKLVDREILKI